MSGHTFILTGNKKKSFAVCTLSR